METHLDLLDPDRRQRPWHVVHLTLAPRRALHEATLSLEVRCHALLDGSAALHRQLRARRAPDHWGRRPERPRMHVHGRWWAAIVASLPLGPEGPSGLSHVTS